VCFGIIIMEILPWVVIAISSFLGNRLAQRRQESIFLFGVYKVTWTYYTMGIDAYIFFWQQASTQEARMINFFSTFQGFLLLLST
jgi:uncharacterized membrane protein